MEPGHAGASCSPRGVQYSVTDKRSGTSTTFQGTLPVTYFLKLGPASTVYHFPVVLYYKSTKGLIL